MSTPDKGLFRDEDFQEVQVVPKKVVCLGKEFPSEEARREYFRNELRKKLPELKNMEGFPIGEDEDIINLSDPPYYTACPNPWLNDFVEEWEKEKVELQKQGKRVADFEVKEPYASDVSEGKNNPIYNAHSYHTKVPHPAIMRYILHYTQPGDIVFDGFCGTGMTGVAAQMCGSYSEVMALKEDNVKVGVRHALCSDLSPIASLISALYNLPLDLNSFVKRAENVLNSVESELGWMYETKPGGKKGFINTTIWSDVFVCPNCGKELVLWDLAVDTTNETIKDSFVCNHCGADCSKKNLEKKWEVIFDPYLGQNVSVLKKVPVKINYTSNGRRGEKDIDNFDSQIIQRCSSSVYGHYNLTKLPDGEKTQAIYNSNHIQYQHQFYTFRTYAYLNRLRELSVGDLFLTGLLTSVAQSTSLMNKFRFSGTGIMTGTFFFPSLCWEFSPKETIKRKLKAFEKIYYPNRGNAAISINSATKLSNISTSSVDYIFIDPPFGANIMYSELSSIWEGWLNLMTNNDTEAVINRKQHKSLFEYQSLMNASFKEFFRILKPSKWMTIEFSNTSASVWNSIQNALQGVGFVVVNVSAIDKKQGSFNAVTTTTAVKQDLVITCYKPSDELTKNFEQSEDKRANVIDFVEELLSHLPIHLEKNNSTTAVIERSPKILYDRLISYYVQHGYAIPVDAQEFQQSLRERFIERDGMFFTASQAVEYEQKKSKTRGMVPMALFVSNEAEGIEWLKRELDNPKTYAEIQPDWMKDLTTPKKGDILPELSTILEENFIKDEEGKWRLPDAEKAADLEILRNRRLLKEFNVYLELANKPKAKRMKDTRLEVLRYGFKECYKQKDFQSIVTVGDHIQESLLQEDEVLLQYYDIAVSRI